MIIIVCEECRECEFGIKMLVIVKAKNLAQSW